MITAPVLLVVLVCGLAAGFIGQGKNLSFGGYFAWGLLFGPIGVIVALCARGKPAALAAPQGPIMGQPGWLIDPRDSRYVRYWDGMSWTEHLHPIAALPQ